MELTRKSAWLLVRTFTILLCKLLLVDVVCSPVSDLLVYNLFLRKFLERRRTTPDNAKTQEDRAKSQEDRGLQVILCGFPRSGSTSLWQAMELLGFPCFHGVHTFSPSLAKLFLKAQKSGSRQDWERLLHGYRSIADYPATSYYKELMEIYPNAKIILNIRDPEKWYNSFSQTLLKFSGNLVLQVVQPCARRCNRVPLYQKLLMGKPEDKELAIINYKRHVEEVKRHVPSHKLLVLEIEKNEGWDPLCKFLEVPVPKVPFPFLNKRANYNDSMSKKFTKIHSFVLISYLVLIFSIIFKSWSWIFCK